MNNPYGPNKRCQRSACAEAPPHLTGRHLDQRDELYDGPDDTVCALNAAPRKAAWALLGAGAPMPEVVDLVEEIHRLNNQVAHVRVDMDRQVRAALATASSCDAHGEQIAQLEGQVEHFSRQGDRNKEGRLALLGMLHAIDDLVQAHRTKPIQASVDDIVAALEKITKRTRDAHTKVWRRAGSGSAARNARQSGQEQR